MLITQVINIEMSKPPVFYSHASDVFPVTYRVSRDGGYISIDIICEESYIPSTLARFAKFNEDYKELNCKFFADSNGGFRIKVQPTCRSHYDIGFVCFYNLDVARQFLELVLSSPQFWFELNTDTSYLGRDKIWWDPHYGKIDKHVLDVMDVLPSLKPILERTRTI